MSAKATEKPKQSPCLHVRPGSAATGCVGLSVLTWKMGAQQERLVGLREDQTNYRRSSSQGSAGAE